MSFGQLPTGLYNQPLGAGSSAVLYMFSPRSISNQAKRPFHYKFGFDFANAAVDAILPMRQGMNASKINAMLQSPTYMGSILPTSMPAFNVDMRQMSENWTFMFLVTNDRTTDSGAIAHAATDNLHIYYGYFPREPVNPLQHGRRTYNPNAIMVVTHKSVINKVTTIGGYGANTTLDNMGDIDIVPSKEMALLSTTPTMLIRPEDLHHDTNFTEGAPIVMTGDTSLLGNLGSNPAVSSSLSVPKHNVGTILRACATAHSAQNAEFESGQRIGDYYRETYNGLVGDALQDTVGHRTLGIGLKLNTMLTLEHIMQRYHPVWHVLELQRQQQYDPIDQTVATNRNVFASMLAAVVPALMAEVLLVDFSFAYNSHAETLGMSPWQILRYATTSPLGEAEAQRKVSAMMHRLSYEIFPIIKKQAGDFDLTMDAAVGSISRITLNFMANASQTPEVFEIPTILGGMNSPMIGTPSDARSNGAELSSLITMLAEGDQHQIPLTGFDQQQLNRALIGHNSSQPLSGELIPPPSGMERFKI